MPDNHTHTQGTMLFFKQICIVIAARHFSNIYWCWDHEEAHFANKQAEADRFKNLPKAAQVAMGRSGLYPTVYAILLTGKPKQVVSHEL